MNDPIEATLTTQSLIRQSLDRPFVSLSYAQGLDGSITAEQGTPYPISGSQSLVMTHQLRAAHDTILIGIGTVLADDPQLTVRLVNGKDPAAVILDSELRLPSDSRLLKASRPTLIFCAEAIQNLRASRLEASGASIHPIRKDGSGFLDLHSILGKLWSTGYRSVMVEGGASVISHFLQARVVDWLVLTIAPVILNGPRVPVADPESFWQPVRLDIKGSATYGNDWVIWGQPDWEKQ